MKAPTRSVSRRAFVSQGLKWAALTAGASAGLGIPALAGGAGRRAPANEFEDEPVGEDLSAAELARVGLRPPEPAFALEGALGGTRKLPDMKVDFVILGAGFSGLAAAFELHKAKRSFVILEARDRIGGRTFSKRFGDDLVLDAGGQWIGPGQDRVAQLASRFGASTFAMYDQGTHQLDTEDRIHSYRGALPGFGQLGVTYVDFGQAWLRLDRLAAKVPLNAPWTHPDAADLDRRTLGQWVRDNCVFTKIERLMRGALEMVFAADLDQISLLHALFYIRSGGGLDSLTRVSGGAQETRFTSGVGDLAHKMAKLFADRIILSSPARAIEQNEGGVTVTSDRVRVRALRVIHTLPPSTAQDLDYGTGVSTERRSLMKLLPMGETIKCMAVYERPYWREQGLSGQAFAGHLPVTATFDNSVPGSARGVLLGFYVGPQAARALSMTKQERREQFLRSLARYFGAPALRPLLYHELVWKEESWSKGCYGAYAPEGVWTRLGPSLRQSSGRIHWAGTETSAKWCGYIEGAVLSGEAAAQEALSLESLRRTS